MEMNVSVFLHFRVLTLLKKEISAKVAPQANHAMSLKMPFGPKNFQKIEWSIPNFLMGNTP